MVGNSYSQNIKLIADYYQRLDEGGLPVFRGVELNADDLLRREVITQLICHFTLDISIVEQKYTVTFETYFSSELAELATMEEDGLLQVDSHTIRVLPAGRLLIRNICMVFDRYLREKNEQRFSKVI